MTTEFLGWLGYHPEVKVTLAHPEDHKNDCALYRNEACSCGGTELTDKRKTLEAIDWAKEYEEKPGV